MAGPAPRATAEDVQRLRYALGDTTEPYQFDDATLSGWIDTLGSVEAAAAFGWMTKAMAAADSRGGLLQYRIGTESVQWLSPKDYRQMALDNASYWQGQADARNGDGAAGNFMTLIPPPILTTDPDARLTEVDLSRLEAEALERPVVESAAVE